MRPQAMTSAPAARKASAITEPMPLAPPVTITARPAKSVGSASSMVRPSMVVPVVVSVRAEGIYPSLVWRTRVSGPVREARDGRGMNTGGR